MKSEQIKQITSKAIEELVAALNAGRSEALTNYLAGMSAAEPLRPNYA